jgi:biopolymer transport protein TolR
MDSPDRRSSDRAPLASINVTPLVDVMLVLLIIFMVTASMGQQGVTVDLPKAAAKPLPVSEDLITISIDSQRRIFINQEPVGQDRLGDRLRAIYGKRKDKTVFVRADQSISYGEYARVIAIIKAAGVTKLGMITEAPKT